MDALVTATLLCLFLPLQKKLSHLSAIMNPANHESALRCIQEYKSKAGVPPPPSWLGRVLAKTKKQKRKTNLGLFGVHVPEDHPTTKTQEAPDGDHRPRDHQTPMVQGLIEHAATAECKVGSGDYLTWMATDPATTKKQRCSCKGNCRRQCPGRTHTCPNVAVINLPGWRRDAWCLPSLVSDTMTETQTQTCRHRHAATQSQIYRHTDTQTQVHSDTGRQTHKHCHVDTDTGMQEPRHLDGKSGIVKH